MVNRNHFIYLSLILLILTSCATDPPGKSDKQVAPAWISERPAAGGLYYIGIGGSNTGDQAEDKEIARSRALTELSSEIYASIESSLDIKVTDSTETGEAYQVVQNISQKVEQNLEAVQTVATFHSDEEGYWYYMRLSRDDWEAIQNKRAAELIQRIDEMFADVFRDTLSELKTIDRAYTEFEEAYTGRKIKMSLFGQTGSVDTLLLIRAEELISALTIPDLNFPSELTQMRSVSFKGSITGESGRNTGALELMLRRNDQQSLGKITTAPDGSFEWLYRVLELPGEVNYQLSLKSPFSNPGLDSRLSYAYPSISISVLVVPLLVRLELETNLEENQSLYERSFDILEKVTPFTLTADDADTTLKLTFTSHEGPENDFGIIYSYGRSFVTLINDEGEHVLWQSEEEKDGGLTVNQARGNVNDKLLEMMERDDTLIQALSELDL